MDVSFCYENFDLSENIQCGIDHITSMNGSSDLEKETKKQSALWHLEAALIQAEEIEDETE